VKQRGFIQLSIMGYVVLGLGTVVLILGTLLKIQTARLGSVKAEYFNFVEKTKLIGEEQERKTKETIARNLKEKETRDAEYKRNVARLERDINRLRNSASRSVVPAAPAEARDPSRATFDRAELDRALREFIGETAEIAGEGAKAVEGLDSLR
jgi:septal ring factor EnvC (AmiA/AmiB activator)